MAGKFKAVTLSMYNQAFEVERDILAKVGAELIPGQGETREELIAAIQDADALLVGSTKITEDIIKDLQKCKIIVRYGIGVDNIDVEAAMRRNIIVSNVPDYCIEEVSSHAMTLLLAWVRKIVKSDSMVKSGKWAVKALAPFPRLKGQTVGILGFGRIGRSVAEKALAFGFNILVSDPYLSKDSIDKTKITLVDFDTLLGESDYLTVHIPATAQTENIMGEAEFRKMKPTALLINTSRGATINEQALIKALREGWIAGAALDVLTKEPPASDNPLLSMDNVLLTPHSAWYTNEAFLELHRKGAEEAARILNGEKALYAIN